jgi:hypothetical protein
VSTGNWTLNQLRLEELEPLQRGREDPEHPGIWFGRVPETNVGVTYVPDLGAHVVYVTMIA